MEKNNETKDRLLEAACIAFTEKGFEKAKVSDIVALASVAQGTFYTYFKSKEECLNTMTASLINGFIDEIKHESKVMDDRAIYRVTGLMLDSMDKYREVLSIMHFEQMYLSEETIELHKSAHEEAYNIIRLAVLAAGFTTETAQVKASLVDAVLAQYMMDKIYLAVTFRKSDRDSTKELIRVIMEEVKV